MENIEISVILPCLNEEKTLEICIKKCRDVFIALNITGEIIVVDNGSTDKSLVIAQNHNVKIVNCIKKGYGIALKTGFNEAKGKYIVMGDADNTYDFLEIPKLYKHMCNFLDCDIITGTRLKGKIEKGAMPFISRYFGTPFLTFLINLIYKTNISDCNCGLKIFKREALNKVKLYSVGMEFVSELIICFKLNNLKIKEIPITLSNDVVGRKPHLRIFRDGLRNLILIIGRKIYEY